MKSLRIFIAGLLFFATTEINAQVSVGINIGPPVWAAGAPAEVHYYYLPDIGVYYDVPSRQYIYLRRGAWVRATVLPARYNGYDLYHSHPVYLTDYRGNTPYVLYKEHRVKYKGNGWKSKEWKKNGHDNGRRGKK